MPLPASDPNAQWPPKVLDNLLPSMQRWSAWFANDLSRLQMLYGGGLSADASAAAPFFASQTGGIKAAVGRTIYRWFVGIPATGTQQNTKITVPIAAEICQASADLLFADPVTATVDDGKGPTQDRLETLLDDNFHDAIAAAAELGAALGGVYLRVTWDDKLVPDGPFTTFVYADRAVPEFRWGRLTAVTFWSVIAKDGKNVYRLLERHELDELGNGVILHGLYMGEDTKLGMKVPLSTRPETAMLAGYAEVDGVEGTRDTQTPGLAVEYVPNITPNRTWMYDPLGQNLGRSDLDGIEHLLDQLAETMSDWMRARRVARARIMLAKDLLKSTGPGQAAIANVDQEVFTELPGALGGPNQALAEKIQLIQPTFDPAGYLATAKELVEQILQMAGYSLNTFGVQSDSKGDRTATEIEARERRSLLTRSRKSRIWKSRLEAHLTKLLAVDAKFFGSPNVVNELTVEFADGVQESQLKLAQTVQALFLAESASLEERLSILHPDWDEDQIGDEVDLIKAEFNHPMPDPQMSPFDQADVTDGEGDVDTGSVG